ncbi:MAG: toprim domain-containing protein [Burkholderiales bacterium]
MARIPESEIQRLKSEVSVERLVEASSVALRRAGKDLLGRCPFHDDAEASLVVTPAKNLWHCFGCQIGGGPIDWVIKTRGVSFRHAVELLREGLPAVAAGAPLKHSTVRRLPAPIALDADDQLLLNQVIGYYHETLKTSPEAIRYLEARGLYHPEMVAKFRLGFANRTLGLRLPDKQRKNGAEIRARLERLGIMRASGHEHFNGSLVIPVIDEAGNVTEVYGRKITDRLRPGTALHLYLPGPHRGAWNLEALAESKEIILCEALIDALSFWGAGFRNVTAAYGVEGLTEDHLAAFKRYGTERVLIAYDRDEAGDRAADKLCARLTAEAIDCYRIQFPKGMDANEYALKVQPASKSLGLAIRKSLWMGRGASSEGREAQPRLAPALEVENCDLKPEPAAPASECVAASREALPSPLAAKEEVPEPLPASPLPASAVPPAPAFEVAAEVKDAEIVMAFGGGQDARRYRVRGLAKNMSYEQLKVNVLASRGEAFHVDTIDLYSAKQRAAYVNAAALELGLVEDLVKTDLGRVLLKLEALQDAQIRKALEPKLVEAAKLTEAEREAALELLRDPRLLDRILADLEACGIVGERTNKLVGYLAATSRKLERPLAVLVQSSSAAGKTSLMDAILAMMPEEERIKYSAMTGQSLFYMGSHDLRHKILAIVEEEGASRASYALKLLQSEGELTIASTGKDPATGNLVTQQYRVEGPVMMFLTTTAIDIDPELQNRCLTLAIDEGRAQTQAIHRLQRERRTLEGLLARARRADLQAVHRNAQRLLRSLGVLNPYAERLSFPDSATRLRRDHEKYLTLIDTIALLHQYQREVKTAIEGGKPIDYVEVALDDIALANALAHEVLGRSLDELPPQTRRLLATLDAFVAERAKRQAFPRSAVRFSRRELREATGWGDTQLKIHLARLVEMEYAIAHRAKNGVFVYELVYDGQGKDGRPFVPGLIDAEALRSVYDPNRSGQEPARSAPGRGAVGPWSEAGRASPSAEDPASARLPEAEAAETAETHSSGGNGEDVSYPEAPVLPLAASSR